MNEIDKKKLFAVGKIGIGSARIASAAAGVLGYGLLGRFAKVSGNAGIAPLVKHSVLGGLKMIKEGVADLKDASSP